MKYYYNKAQPNIEYGMLSSRYLNNPKRKPNADCLVTYYYTSVSEPLGGTYYRNRDYYIIPVKVTPKVYAQLMKRDKKEHNNNHKHDRRYLDVEKYYRQRGEIDEDDRETNAWECIADKKTLNFENDIIEELDKKALLSTFSKSDRLIVKLYEAGVGQKHIAKKIGKTQSYVSKRLERLLDLIEAERLNDGSRTKKEIEFELAWKKFIYSHKMPKDIDVIFETFNYLIGERMLEELLIYFYSFREYYYYAYLFESYQKEKKTHNDHDKALRAITLFRTQEPEAFARVFYRATSVLQPFLPIGEQPAPFSRNRLREIEEEIRKEQEQNSPTPRKGTVNRGGLQSIIRRCRRTQPIVR